MILFVVFMVFTMLIGAFASNTSISQIGIILHAIICLLMFIPLFFLIIMVFLNLTILFTNWANCIKNYLNLLNLVLEMVVICVIMMIFGWIFIWGMFWIVDYCWRHFLKFYFFLCRDQFIHPLRIITLSCRIMSIWNNKSSVIPPPHHLILYDLSCAINAISPYVMLHDFLLVSCQEHGRWCLTMFRSKDANELLFSMSISLFLSSSMGFITKLAQFSSGWFSSLIFVFNYLQNLDLVS